jgi:hypothetical protein
MAKIDGAGWVHPPGVEGQAPYKATGNGLTHRAVTICPTDDGTDVPEAILTDGATCADVNEGPAPGLLRVEAR